MADLTIPFVILLLIVIFLLINRSRFESDVKKQFEDELEKYKLLEKKEIIQPKSKELKGKYGIETIKNRRTRDPLEVMKEFLEKTKGNVFYFLTN